MWLVPKGLHKHRWALRADCCSLGRYSQYARQQPRFCAVLRRAHFEFVKALIQRSYIAFEVLRAVAAVYDMPDFHQSAHQLAHCTCQRICQPLQFFGKGLFLFQITASNSEP